MNIITGRNYLGDFLVDTGVISQAQLDLGLIQQNEKKSKGNKILLGQILVDMGFCTQEDIVQELAKKVGVPYYSFQTNEPDEAAIRLITPEAAQRYQALPVQIDGSKLIVAMMHPNNVITIDDLRILTGYDIQPVLALDRDLKTELDRLNKAGNDADIEQEAQFFSQMKQSLDQLSTNKGGVSDVDVNVMGEEIIEQDESTERPAVQLANIIFNQAIRSGASDIHIDLQEKTMRVRFRIDGVLHEMMEPPRRLHPSLISRIKVMANMDIAERRIPQDGRITMRLSGKTIDVRVASIPAAYGEKLTMRLLDRSSQLLTLQDLGFPKNQLQKFDHAMHLPYGFILVTGPTGSGKSTTLYSALVQLNSTDKHIITLEDPIERRLDGINQIQVNAKAGMTFSSGLRSILRNDPDIVMIGEIRDQETARIAVESALTGHLVLSTLHTNDSAGAVTRLIDMGIEPYLTSSSLVGVLAQRLVRLLCPFCKEPYPMNRKELLDSVPDFPLEEEDNILQLYRPNQCSRCNNTGYKGRRGVYEFLAISETLQKMILNRASTPDIVETAIAEGMITLRQDGLIKVKQGLTSLEEILRVII